MAVSPVDFRPISIQRADMGLSTPMPEEKLAIWSEITIPQTSIKKETGGYSPFSITRQAHFHPARVKLVTGGIRGSKSVGLAMEHTSWFPHADLQWLGGQSYDDTRQEFEYILEAVTSLGWTENALISFPHNRYSPCTIETYWGSLLETKSLADDKALMSRAPDVVGICEPGKTDIGSYRHAKERTSTKRGLLMMYGTLETSAPWFDEFWHKWKRWPNIDNAKSWSSPTYINKVLFPKGIYDPEIGALRNSSEDFDEYLRRIVGVPASQPDMIMSKHWKPRIHIGSVPYERKDAMGQLKPVYLAIDPGYSGESRYVVLAIQLTGNKLRIIDEVCVRGLTHSEVRKACMSRVWWPVAHTGTIDPYAGESHIYGAVSPAGEWAQDKDGYGKVSLETPQRLNVDDLIRLIQTYLLGATGFNLEVDQKCERLRYEMQCWKRIRVPQGLGIPSKANCDAIKALGYFLTHHSRGLIGPHRDAAQAVRVSDYSLTGTGTDPVALAAEMASMYQGPAEWLGPDSGNASLIP